MEQFERIWESARPAFACSPTHRRAGCLALAALACLGRRTMSGVISAAGAQFRDWSASYRLVEKGRFDRRELFRAVIQEAQSRIAPCQPVHICLDDTSLRKTGRKVAGAQWRADRMGPKFQVNLVWAQRFLQISMALPEAENPGSRVCMVPVEFMHCPGAGKPPKNPTSQQRTEFNRTAAQAALPAQAVEALAHMRGQIDPERLLVCSGDGGYTNRMVLKNLPPRTIFVGRIRKDAKLFEPPASQPLLGRRRIYGPETASPEEFRTSDEAAWQTLQVHLGGQLRSLEVKTKTVRWKAAGEKDLKLIVIRPLKYKLSENGRTLYRDPVYLISTDSQYDTQTLVQNYIWRWGIEQNFRDEKQVVGIGESYMRSAQSVQAMPALLVAAYATLRLACRSGQTPNLARPKWHRRANSNPLTANREIAILRNSLWGRALKTSDEHFTDFALENHPNQKPPKLQNSLKSAVIYAIRC